MTRPEVDNLVQVLGLLIECYAPDLQVEDLDGIDNRSYSAGFRAGARSAYMDVVCRLRELRAEQLASVTRIGGAA